ncbi:nucleoside 2-deoxyribosyltransferase [Candidatus Saccharibacteria bacterium]|nr:nucleoside 2-deoxyribosyltransferase [Candidatus Saccharibacteria bacterium]
MKIFVATSFSSQIDYSTGQVSSQFMDFLKSQLDVLDQFGETFSAVRDDNHLLNQTTPEEAFRLDMDKIKEFDVLVAFLGEKVSAGVQTEIGIALAFDKKVLLATTDDVELGYFNKAILRAGAATKVALPLDTDELRNILN